MTSPPIISRMVDSPISAAINALILALIVLALTGLFQQRPVHHYRDPTRQAVTTSTPTINSIELLMRANLFGMDTKVKEPEPGLNAPPTRLDLVLRGVLEAKNPADARAIIGLSNGQVNSYGLDDTLPGNARITHFYTDRVILLHKGVRESLQLSLPVGSQPPGSGGQASPDNQRPGTSATITGFREQFSRNPEILADFISAEAVTLKNGQSGWRLTAGRNSQFFDQLGLQPGDLVLSINSVSAGSGMSRVALLNELATADQLNLKVLRKEKVLSFYFTMIN